MISSIGRIGILYPLLVSKEGVVADGHRRLAAANALGMKKVLVIRRSLSAEEMIEVANSSTRKLGDKEWGQIAPSGEFPMDQLPPKVRIDYEEFVRCVGPEKADYSLRRFSPRIVR